MQNTETELYRDAIAQLSADRLTHEQIRTTNLLASNGAEFNIGIWAAIRLSELTNNQRG